MPDNNNQFRDFLSQAGQQATGAALGLVLGKHNDRRQFKQATKLGHLQLGLNKLQMDYNMQKQLEMWAATGPQAQMEQLRKAGLNPGLIYGMGGAGGQTASVAPGNISSGGAAGHTGEAVAMASTAAQLGLMRAQKENIEADTANKQADTANKPILGKNIEASTASITQGIKESQAKTELIKAEEQIRNVELEVKQQTQNVEISRLQDLAELVDEQLTAAVRENAVNKATANDRIKTVKLNLVAIGLENELRKSQKNLTDEQIKKVTTEIRNLDWDRYISGETLNELRFSNFIKRNSQISEEMKDEVSELVSSLIGGIIGGRISRGNNAPTQIKGFKTNK